jgi:hypothetical protein
VNAPTLFQIEVRPKRPSRSYSNVLTADINRKGVLDIDTVKGCTAGMHARPDGGCYNGCYAARIAAFRGIDFSKAVSRTAQTRAQRAAIERIVSRAPQGFFRIGTMGDPSHDWDGTVATIEWLSPLARPVIITKHWRRATDENFSRLIRCRAVLNTSVSGLDTAPELEHRKREIERYRSMGGRSVARVVSCKFNRQHPEGARMGAIQDGLFAMSPLIDNPLRAPRTHRLVVAGIIELVEVRDLDTMRTVSLERPDTYLGHCSRCPDLCGIDDLSTPIAKAQTELWQRG